MRLTSSRFSTLIAASAFLIFYVTGEPLIDSIFGNEYEGSLRPLILLSIGQLINAIMGPVGFLLSMTGNEKIVTQIFGLTACLNILMNLLFIPLFGIQGAAVATMISVIIWNVVLRQLALNKLNIETLAIGVPKI